MLQVMAPQLMLDWQKVFDDVAEAFDPDAQRMQRNLRAVAHGAGVKFASRGPALQGQMLEYRAAGADAGGPLGKNLAPVPPLLAVELPEGGTGFVFFFGFAALQNHEQSVRCRIARGIRFLSRNFFLRFEFYAGDTPLLRTISRGLR